MFFLIRSNSFYRFRCIFCIFCIIVLVLFQNFAKIIRSSLFGIDGNKKLRDLVMFPQNSLVITSLDIQSVEPE